jgi:U3 small nucleolar ribonucleoprotein component
MRVLFDDLDALSHAHFTPAPLAAEVRLVTNVRSMRAEEAGATVQSTAHTLAPEQVLVRVQTCVPLLLFVRVQASASSAPKAADERNVTDKKRERRLKKQHQADKAQRDEAKQTKTNKVGWFCNCGHTHLCSRRNRRK